MANSRRELMEELKEVGVLETPEIIDASLHVDRADFVPEYLHRLAYEDRALPIGAGQTISQPRAIAFMLERLDVHSGQRILDVGYGSGWQAALLAYLTGSSGSVYAMELSPELCDQGKENLRKYPELAGRVRLFCRSALEGCIEGAPFDRIIAAAEVFNVPEAWREQLKPLGKMMYPQGGDLVLETKRDDGFYMQRFRGFAFVPFLQ